jgi:hypothetical protein
MAAVDQADYLTITPAGAPLQIRLNLSVLGGIASDAMRGFGVTRRRGTEAGGLLLGRRESVGESTLWIDGYEEVACEYSQGPSYLLSESDTVRFSEAISRHRGQVAGFYRSHTRPDLQPDDADARLFDAFFPDPAQVVLLVKPFATRPPSAAVFGRQDGRLALETPIVPEFPFVRPAETKTPVVPAPEPPAPRAFGSRSEIRPDPPPIRPEPPPIRPDREIEEPVSKPVFTPRPPSMEQRPVEGQGPVDRRPMFSQIAPEPRFRWKRALLWGALAGALMTFGAVAGYRYAALQPLTAAPVAVEDPFSIDLQITQQDADLMIRWRRDAPAIQFAQRGVLRIAESGVTREIQLGYSELRNGTILYRNLAPEVRFELQLISRDDRSLFQAVTWPMPGGDATAP